MTRRLIAAAPFLTLVGCTGDGRTYPSLAPRPVETRGFAEPAAPPLAAVVADPALDAQVTALTQRLDAVVAGFTKAADEAERRAAAARGRPAGSDAWLDAQTALAGLDDWRAQASALATDVEDLAIARAATLAPPYPSLSAIGERTEAEGVRQGAMIARLQAMLAPA